MSALRCGVVVDVTGDSGLITLSSATPLNASSRTFTGLTHGSAHNIRVVDPTTGNDEFGVWEYLEADNPNPGDAERLVRVSVRESKVAGIIGSSAVDWPAGAKRVFVDSADIQDGSLSLTKLAVAPAAGLVVATAAGEPLKVGTPAEARAILDLPPAIGTDDWWLGGYAIPHTNNVALSFPGLLGAARAGGSALSRGVVAPGPWSAMEWRSHASNANSGYDLFTNVIGWNERWRQRALARIRADGVRTWIGWSTSGVSGVVFFFTGLDVEARVGAVVTATTVTLVIDEWYWFEIDGNDDNTSAIFRVRRASDGVVVWEEEVIATMPAAGSAEAVRHQAIFPVNPGGVTAALDFGAWFVGTPNGIRFAMGRA